MEVTSSTKRNPGIHYTLLGDNKINQDILETLNELSHQEKYFKEKHFVDVARNLNRTRGR